MKTKYALVLSGGGFNGAFQLGVLNYIKNHWKSITGLSTPPFFDIVAGVSVGALNGAMIAMNKWQELEDLWLKQIAKNGVQEIYVSELIDTSPTKDKLSFKPDISSILKRLKPSVNLDLNWRKKLKMVFSKKHRKTILKELLQQVISELKVSFPKFKSIADNAPLRKKLEVLLDRELIPQTKYLCGFVSLDTGKYHGVLHDQFDSNEDFIRGVLASTSMPIVWSPVEDIAYTSSEEKVISKNNIDGGIKNVSPLGDVIKLINEDPEDCRYQIIVINCHSGIHEYVDYSNKSIAAIAYRSVYEFATAEIFNNDVAHFLKVNDLIRQAKAWDKDIALFSSLGDQELKSFEAIVINPEPGVLGNSLLANHTLINSRFDHGASQAEKAFESPKNTGK